MYIIIVSANIRECTWEKEGVGWLCCVLVVSLLTTHDKYGVCSECKLHAKENTKKKIQFLKYLIFSTNFGRNFSTPKKLG